jgi:hypothetical protein
LTNESSIIVESVPYDEQIFWIGHHGFSYYGPETYAGSQTIASPLNWTIARLIAIFPSSANAIPIAPSLPTIAASVI